MGEIIPNAPSSVPENFQQIKKIRFSNKISNQIEPRV
jgi:hypothetical protein